MHQGNIEFHALGIERIVTSRVGRKAGKGFYEYGEDGKPTRIWPELSSKIEAKVKECPPALKAEPNYRRENEEGDGNGERFV